MKHRQTILEILVAGGLFASLASAQPPRFTVTDLGVVGAAGQPFVLTNNSLVSGAVTFGNTVRGVLYFNGRTLDIGSPGLHGPNSMAFGVNPQGQAVGEAETFLPDRQGEDFCGFAALGLQSSGATCLPFVWQNGAMKPLQTLGGANGAANQINRRGEVAGMAENTIPDSTCPKDSPQKFQFKPMLWRNGNLQELPTYPGDPDGNALAINDNGQIAGGSGDCTAFSPITLTSLQSRHALLWENGKATDLGTLGGTGNGNGIEAVNLNNSGQIVGNSDLAGDTGFHAFLWTRETGMQDLGTVKGDVNSAATSINDAGQIVGVSLDADFNPRAFLQVGKELIDLNGLIPGGSPLYLATACFINARGEIIGIAIDKNSGDVHGYQAVPAPGDHRAGGPASPSGMATPSFENFRKPPFLRYGMSRH